MAFFRSYQCPDCGGVFKFLHHPNAAPPPDECELCHASMLESEPVFVAQAPRIATAGGQKHDQVYRQLETASEARAELMAEHGGGSASDYSHTKITNLSDSRYQGDVAAVIQPPANPVQSFMAQQAPAIGGGYAPLAGGTGIEYAQQTRSGPFPYAGARASDGVRAAHSRLAAAVAAQGRINKS